MFLSLSTPNHKNCCNQAISEGTFAPYVQRIFEKHLSLIYPDHLNSTTHTPKVTIGMTMVRKIMLQVATLSPFRLMPSPAEAFKALLPLAISSSTRLLFFNTQALMPTWSYSSLSCTRQLPNLNTLFLLPTSLVLLSSP